MKRKKFIKLAMARLGVDRNTAVRMLNGTVDKRKKLVLNKTILSRLLFDQFFWAMYTEYTERCLQRNFEEAEKR